MANFVVWTPLVIISIALTIVDNNIIPLGVYSATYFSFMSNSILHPLIEGFFISEIKMTFKDLFGISYLQKIIRKRSVNADVGVNEISTTSKDSRSATPTTPTGNCLDTCSIAVLHLSHPEVS